MDTRKIVCPVDFSPCSDAAIRCAASLAAESGAKLYIIHVDEQHASSSALGEDSFEYFPVGCHLDDHDEPSRLEQLKPTSPLVEFEHRYLAGEPIHEIVAFAEREHADLVVMGSHGRTGWSRLLMGSVAEGVVRRAACSVLIVKQPPANADAPSDDSMVLRE